MFVEKLTKKDLDVFILALGLKERYDITSVEHIKLLNINRWEIKMKSKSTGIKSRIFFEDFNVYGNSHCGTQKIFKAFMYAKFGEEYKNAFNENLRKKYEEEMIK